MTETLTSNPAPVDHEQSKNDKWNNFKKFQDVIGDTYEAAPRKLKESAGMNRAEEGFTSMSVSDGHRTASLTQGSSWDGSEKETSAFANFSNESEAVTTEYSAGMVQNELAVNPESRTVIVRRDKDDNEVYRHTSYNSDLALKVGAVAANKIQAEIAQKGNEK